MYLRIELRILPHPNMLRNSILEGPLIVVERSFRRYVDVATIQDGDSVLYKYHQKVGRGVYGPSRIAEKTRGGTS